MTARTTAFALCFATLVLAAAPTPAAAQVHRWVDERGVVQYGDRPPTSGATVVRTPAAAPAPAAAPTTPTTTTSAPAKPAGAPKDTSTSPRAAPAKPSITERLLAQQRVDGATALGAQSAGMQQLIANCKANRGVDCDTPQGMSKLQRENTAITSEEQARIAGLGARRATCARAGGGLGCP